MSGLKFETVFSSDKKCGKLMVFAFLHNKGMVSVWFSVEPSLMLFFSVSFSVSFFFQCDFLRQIFIVYRIYLWWMVTIMNSPIRNEIKSQIQLQYQKLISSKPAKSSSDKKSVFFHIIIQYKQ